MCICMSLSFISIPNLPHKYNSIDRLFALFLPGITKLQLLFQQTLQLFLKGGA